MEFRAVPEVSDKNIREWIIKALAICFGLGEKVMDIEIDKIYRINSRFAWMRDIPVLVQFVRRRQGSSPTEIL